jgi:hypothetical protein
VAWEDYTGNTYHEKRRRELALALLMARVFADDAAYALAHDNATVFATGADGWADFHGRGSLRCVSRSGWSNDFAVWTNDVTGAEAIDDATLGQIVRRHFYLHAVTGENAHLVHAHASSKVAKQFVILCFLGSNTNAERGVWIRFFYNANEFDYVFRQRKEKGKKTNDRAGRSYRVACTGARRVYRKTARTVKLILKNTINIV